MMNISNDRAILTKMMAMGGGLHKISPQPFETTARAHNLELRSPDGVRSSRPMLAQPILDFASNNALEYTLRYDVDKHSLMIGTSSCDDLDLFIIAFG